MKMAFFNMKKTKKISTKILTLLLVHKDSVAATVIKSEKLLYFHQNL